MTASPTTHYLNADFDLSLRLRPRQVAEPGIARQVRELSAQALLGADAGDSALIHVDVPSRFLEHLAECGVTLPRLLRHPAVDPAARLRPFGWSAEAIELNRLHGRPAKHPTLDCIRKVNSRGFTLELETDLSPDGPTGKVVQSLDALESHLEQASAASQWVIKADHGHAGLANRRLRQPRLTPIDRRFVARCLAEDDRLLIEPWLPRDRDGSVVFHVPFDPSTLRVHESFCTRDGAFIGVLFGPTDDGAARWSEELARMAERVASRLQAEGYFGPVCVDAFSWHEGDRSRLRPIVDLNCRLSVSDGAHRLWRSLAPEQTFYYRFFNRRKLELSDDLEAALAALASYRYDRTARRGILPASPLSIGDGAEIRRPGKLAVIFVADDRPGVFELEDWFRRRFEV